MSIPRFCIAGVTLLIAAALTSCSSLKFDAYYNACAHAPTVPLAKRQMARIEEPVFIQDALTRYEASGYVIIGMMTFHTSDHISKRELADFATQKGASVVLYASYLKDSQQVTVMAPVASYSSGYNYGNIYGRYESYQYTGTSMMRTTRWVPRTHVFNTYDNLCVFLAKKA